MANRFWVGGTANWDGTAGTKWATTSGGTGGAAIPTAGDDVFLDGNSGAVTVTISAGNTGCKSLVCTGFTGTLTGSTAITVSGGLTVDSGMTYSYTGAMTFDSTSTGWVITSAGKTLDHDVTFNGSGGGWGLGDATNWGDTRSFTLTQGRFDTNGYAMSGGRFISSNTNTRVFNLSSSVVTWKFNSGAPVPIWTTSTSTNLTLSFTTGIVEFTAGNTRSVTIGSVVMPSVRLVSGSQGVTLSSGASVLDLIQASSYTGVLANSALTIRGNLSLHSSSGTPAAGSNAWTFAATSGSYTINSGGKTLDFPINIGSGSSTATWTLASNLTSGASRDLTLVSGTLEFSTYDITVGVFAANSGTLTRAINFGSGALYLTRTSSSTIFILNATNLTVTPGTGKFVLSGASAITRIVDGGSDTLTLPSLEVTAGSSAIILSNLNVNNLTFTSGYTGTLANQAIKIRGSVTLPSTGPTFSAGSNAWTLIATSGSMTITVNGRTTAWPWVFGNAPSTATWTLAGNLNLSTQPLTVLYGTFSAATYDVAALEVISTGSGTRAISLGSGTWTLSSGTPWTDSGTGLTVTPGTSSIVCSAVFSASFTSEGKAFYDVAFSANEVYLYGDNTFHALNYVKADGSLYIEENTTTHVTVWGVAGTAGHLLTVTSINPAYHFIEADGAAQVGNYLDLMWSVASPDADWSTTNSVDSGNNVGWFDTIFPFYSGTRTVVPALSGINAAVLAANPGDVLVLAEGFHDLTEDVPLGVTLRGASCSALTVLQVNSIAAQGGNTFRDLTIISSGVAFDLSDNTWFENCTFKCQVYSGGPAVNKHLTFSRCTFLGQSSIVCEGLGTGYGTVSWLSCLFKDQGNLTTFIQGADFTWPLPNSTEWLVEHCTFILSNIGSIATSVDLGTSVVYRNNVTYQPETNGPTLGGDASSADTGENNYYQDSYAIPSPWTYAIQVRNLGLDLSTGALRNSSPARSAGASSNLVLDRNYMPYGAVGSRSAGCLQWHEESSCLYTPWFLDPLDGFILEYEPGSNLPGVTTAGEVSGVTQVNSHIDVACLLRKVVHDLTHPSRGDFHTTYGGQYRMRTYNYPMNLSIQAPASRIFGSTGLVWGQDTG